MRPYKKVNNSEFQPNSIIVSSELNLSGKSNLTAFSFGTDNKNCANTRSSTYVAAKRLFGTDNKNCANTRKVGIGAVIYVSSG